MRKILLLLMVFCLVFTPICNAEIFGTITTLFDGEVIESTGDASSRAIHVKGGGVFGIWYQATSAVGTADVKLEVLMSYDDTSGNFIEPDNMSDITSSVSDEAIHVDSIYPPPMKYIKIKCTGVASNPADTVITAYLFTQSE